MVKKSFFIFVLVGLSLVCVIAQEMIFQAIEKPDSATHATVKIHQDKRVEEFFQSRYNAGKAKSNQPTVAGFRIQVFSSESKTAKNDAYNIEQQVKVQFPNLAVYVYYSSPSWKVRVGDFLTQSDAQKFQAEFLTAFPTMKSEVYIVKEQIVGPTKK
jgi:SPOR domain